MQVRWTAEEDALVRQYYTEVGPKKMAYLHLPGRTAAAVRSRAVTLGVEPKVRRWRQSKMVEHYQTPAERTERLMEVNRRSLRRRVHVKI